MNKPTQPALTYSIQMDVVTQIIKATASILDLSKLLKSAVKLIQEKLNFYHVALFLIDEDGKTATLQAESGQDKLPAGQKFDLKTSSPLSECLNSGLNYFIPEADKLATAAGVELALPLAAHQVMMGVLIVHRTAEFSPQDRSILQTITDQLAIAIDNARVFDQVAFSQRVAEDLLHETIALQQLSQALSGTLQIDEILDIFVQTCTKVLGFDYVMFSQVDKKAQRVKAIAGVGVTESHLKRSNHPLSSEDIMADIIRTGHTEIIIGDDPRYNHETYESEGHAEWGSRVFAPVKLRGENIGLVEVGYNKHSDTEVQDSQIRLLRAFIDQTALALDNAQRYQASQRAIHREALLKEFTSKVRSSTNLEVILQTAIKEIGDALGSKRTYVHVIAPTTEERP
jgi:GAF domain-containing protein